MKTINPNLYPRDGYYFRESDGIKIHADTWAGVVARVVLYRQRAGLPPGEPLKEVTEQACSRNAGLCVETDGRQDAHLKQASLKTRILKWLSEVVARARKGDIPFVLTEVARSRADICARCSNNASLPTGCSSCTQAVIESRKAAVGGRFLDGRLNECIELGEDLPVSIHLDHQAMENSALPAHCWRKRTL